jgi:pimeloyl-ACP methyl ester carboxylesterase
MTYLLIPGAGCTPWHWHPLTAELERRGRHVIAVDLPCDDDAADLGKYIDTAVDAHDGSRAADDQGLVVVGHSLGGMTAPLVCERLPVDLLVFVAGMIPTPGERISEWRRNTGYVDSDDGDTFFADLPADLAAEAQRRLRDQSDRPMNDPCPLTAWPDVPTRAVIARDDLLFPREFMRRATRDRLGIEPDEVSGGHFPMLGHPVELADRLEGYRGSTGRAEPTMA